MAEDWSARTSAAVAAATPYGPRLLSAWVKAVEREADRSGEHPIMAADRLARFVRAHEERYGHTLRPEKLGKDTDA